MGDRKDDVRIYIIFVFFFVCSTSGGILLCLYIFLPSTFHTDESWFALLGLVLVAVPWIVWFLVYLYRCFIPMIDAGGGAQFRPRNTHDNKNKPSSGSSQSESAIVGASVSSYQTAVAHSQNNAGGGGGERRVHFGAVVVVETGSSRGSNSSHSQRQHHHRREEFPGELERTKEREDGMSESERPLTSVTDRS